jgi:dephospho-CoA kinase
VPVLGLTGGIATGKSTFAPRLLREIPGARYFDSDACVHELLAGDDGVRESILAAFGSAALGDDDRPSRSRLRAIVFSSDERRKTLESILHPAVRAAWTALAATARANGEWLVVDIPLLYETGAEKEFDRVIVVACPPETQRKRLISERGLALELAETIMAAQLDVGIKTQRADHVIWNDSTVSNLDGQTRLLAAWLKQHFGDGNVSYESNK